VKIGFLQNRLPQICAFALLAVAFDPPLVIRQYLSKFHDDEKYIVEKAGNGPTSIFQLLKKRQISEIDTSAKR
jgi:hypothetical protein